MTLLNRIGVRLRLPLSLAILAATILAILSIHTAFAQEPLVPPLEAQNAWRLPAALQTDADFVKVIVELASPSAADIWIAQSASAAAAGEVTAADLDAIAAATAAQVAAVAAEQDALSASLALLGAQEIYRVQRVYNAIAIRVAPTALAQIAALPGVRKIHPLIEKFPDNAHGVPLIGAPELWDAVGASGDNLTGEGISIGIIDTGADYLHVGLGGPGAGYAENDATIIGDVAGFPNFRIAGGWDFAGDNYNPNFALQPYDPVAQPDPDPMDCYDHGTHVAATAGGNGVTATGVAYTGPYTSAIDFPSMRIAPGVAPHATLFVLKVFGCVGSSDIVDQAIEWAMDPNGDGNFIDHLDVINMSLGAPVGNSGDMTTLASERAAQVGIIVVSSMGNSGDTWFTVGSPGVSSRAITVAATRVEQGTDNDTIATFTARGPRTGDNGLKPDISAPGVAIVSALNQSGSGATALNGTSMATPFVAGSMALLRQQYPLWTVEELKALAMNTTAVVRAESEYDGAVSPPTHAGAGRIALHDAIRSDVILYNADAPGAVALSFGSPQINGSGSALHNLRVTNKSATPTWWTIEYIPVTDMPGVEITLPSTTTVALPPNGSTTLPVIMYADSAQMQNVRDPALPAHQNGTPRQWRAEEMGHIYLWESSGALAANLTSADATPPNDTGATATAIFTYTPETRVLSYTLASTSIAAADILTVTIARGLVGQTPPDPAFTLFEKGGGPDITLPLTGAITLDPVDVRLLASNYLQLVVGTSTHENGQVAGAIIAASPVLKLPLHAAPRPVATMRALTSTLEMSTSLTANRVITLAGTSLAGAIFPTDTQSIVGAFELHASSPRNTPDDGSTVPEFADIKFVGVASDYNKVANKADARLFFAIGTWGEWSTLHQQQITIRIDTDGDLIGDYDLYTTDASAFASSRSYSDSFYTAVESIIGGVKTLGDPINIYPPDERLTAVFQNDVVVLSIPVSLLGMDAAKSAFSFSVDTVLRSPAYLEMGDSVPTMTYDFRRPGIAQTDNLAGTPWLDEADGTNLNFAFNLVNYSRSTARGILLIHPHNAGGLRAETIAINYQWPFNLRLPLIMTAENP